MDNYMDHPEITFSEDGDFVSVWVGMVGTKNAVDAYIEEQYDDDRDDDPISAFAADIGLKFYDHDFLEVHHEPGLSDGGASAFAKHSAGESFADIAWAAAGQRDVQTFDTVFLLYGYDHMRYPQAHRQPEKVKFLGTFAYRKVRDEWFERLIAGEFDVPKAGS